MATRTRQVAGKGRQAAGKWRQAAFSCGRPAGEVNLNFTSEAKWAQASMEEFDGSKMASWLHTCTLRGHQNPSPEGNPVLNIAISTRAAAKKPVRRQQAPQNRTVASKDRPQQSLQHPSFGRKAPEVATTDNSFDGDMQPLATATMPDPA